MTGQPTYTPGDYVKFEVRNEQTGESEWMWLKIDCSDAGQNVVCGTLDSQPVVFADTMKLGQGLVVSYENIREHRKRDQI
jgi:hypothetical protein